MVAFVPFIAEMLGYGLLFKNFSDLITGKPVAFKARVENIMNRMAEGGFGGEKSSVYQDGEGRFTCAVESSNGGFDACEVFFEQDGRLITMIEGPAILALREAGTEVRAQKSPEVAKKLFAPARELQKNVGTLLTGYSQPSVYETDDGGTVNINYWKTGSNTGKVKIYARSGPGLRVSSGVEDYERQLDFSFPTVQRQSI